MKKTLISSLALFAVLVFSFPAHSRKYEKIFNLASEPKYYQYVEYKSSYTSEHILLLTVIDKRPEEEKVYKKGVQYFYDEIWVNPPAEMLEEIFLKELRFTNMFRAVDVDERDPSLILKIELISLIGNYGKGRMAMGVLKTHAVLKSAKDNSILMDKDYEEISQSVVGRFGNAYRPMIKHIGIVFHNVVENTLMDLENTLRRENHEA